MKRKRITADELAFLVLQKLSESDAIATSHPAIAIVPHATLNWAVVFPRGGRRQTPQFIKRIEQIQSELRNFYLLAE